MINQQAFRPLNRHDASLARESATARVERLFVIPASVEPILVVVSVFWALTANRTFLAAVLKDRAPGDPQTWGLALALIVLLAALHFLFLGLFAWRRTVKPLLALLLVSTALATYFIGSYGVFLDPTMMRNILRTDPSETRELLSSGLLAQLVLYGLLPLLLLWRVRIVERPPLRALGVRLCTLLLAVAVAAVAVLAAFKPISSALRKHKEVRYLVTPANFLWSLGSVIATDLRRPAGPKQPIGLDAVAGPSWATRSRPLLVVLVVGETARAANWGLNGYTRQTTPELAALPVVNFDQVTSCGTSTEVSVPCLFAPVGRRDYDEARIADSESLLHLLARVGVGVHWRDNQAGCKGVCDGLTSDSVIALDPMGMCSDGRCFDAGLLTGIDERLRRTHGVEVLVLHQLGNHGPSYFRRYPPAFARYQPACMSDDLSRCTQQEIINAYDNALLYTDHVLATLIAKLQAHADTVDSAMLYVSDHGESLGEHQLFLHGIPYAIAPQEQKRVPMVLWLSDGFRRAVAVDSACLARRAHEPASHDHVFHTLLGMLDVRTALYEREWDLLGDCRGGTLRRIGAKSDGLGYSTGE